MSVVYQPIPLTSAKDPALRNTCNHKSDLTLDEYHRKLEVTHKDSWINVLPDGSVAVAMSPPMVQTLSKANTVYSVNGQVKMSEELQMISTYIDLHMKDGDQYFVRFSQSSPKDGQYKCGPVTTGEQVVRTIITSKRMTDLFSRIANTREGATLYLSLWNPHIVDINEFRVFVYRGRITAISQYVWSEDAGWRYHNLRPVVDTIIDFCRNQIIPRTYQLAGIEDIDYSCTIDVNYCAPEVLFIELNSFGRELAAGSALFQWDVDRSILYSDGSKVVVRYVSDLG